MKGLWERMNIGMIIIIFVFTLLMVFGIMVISVYNKCVFYRDRVLDKYNEIDKLLDDRINYINNLNKVLDDNNLHEERVMRALNKLKKNIREEESVNDKLLLLDDDSIDMALELNNTYKKLDKDKLFNSVKSEYDNNKHKVNYAVDIYNKEVLEYNSYKDIKFNNRIFKFFKFMEYNCYDK